MNVTIFGLGYVGCVTAACFADRGHSVTGIDSDGGKVDMINSGESPIIEPGLSDIIKKTVANGSLKAVEKVDRLGDVTLVCVGTPSAENGSLGLNQIKRVAEEIGALLRNTGGFPVICIRSTVLPGTVEEIIAPLIETASSKTVGKDFGLCMNPEFLRETTAISDFHNPPFTVIGSSDRASADRVFELYAGIDAPEERTSIAEAETIKYACNAFHALKVCFANEIGVLGKKLGIDSHRVMEIFCRDSKLNLSPYYLKPGFAFGGSCLPKDLRAILYRAKTLDLILPLLGSILESNRLQLEHGFNLVTKTGKKRIGILGLSFKAGTDDLRESPNVQLIELLIGKGYEISVFDREVSLSALRGANRSYIEKAIPHISKLLVTTVSELFDNSEALVIAKPHPELSEQLLKLSSKMPIVDLVRNFADLHKTQHQYEGIAW